MIPDGWNPAPEESVDVLAPEPLLALAGLFGTVPPEREAPPLWHWLFHLERHPQHALGPDGHPRDGRFLPPLQNRRRMFAGARFTALAPFLIGDRIVRRTELADARTKRGSTGELLFTTVRHEFRRGGTLVAVEEQDLVYRSGGPTAAPQEPLPQVPGELRETGPGELVLRADPVLLFRFSALTYNAHRIHYDHAYATGVEGHRGLVVHGPLLAILLAEPARRSGRRVTELTFRAHRPVFAGVRTVVRSDEKVANALLPDGKTAMSMTFQANVMERAV
ncbi:MaoC family dehydratase N-terminal domain-containing protein [Actinocorallia lasiicapitis]